MITVNIIDNQPVSRLGLACLVEDVFPGSIVEFSEDAQSFLKRNRKVRYDLLIIRFQGLGNEDILSIINILSQSKGLKVLVTSCSGSTIYPNIFSGMASIDYIGLDTPVKDIKEAIKQLIEAGTHTFGTESEFNGAFFQRLSKNMGHPLSRLSKREQEIALLFLKGKKPSDIGKQLHLQPSTVSTFKSRIYGKLNITNLVELVKIANSFSQRGKDLSLYS